MLDDYVIGCNLLVQMYNFSDHVKCSDKLTILLNGKVNNICRKILIRLCITKEIPQVQTSSALCPDINCFENYFCFHWNCRNRGVYLDKFQEWLFPVLVEGELENFIL